MKKLILILSVFAFTGQQIIAQTESDIPLDRDGNGIIYRNTGGADRGTTSGVFGTQGHWSTDLVISEKSPTEAAGDFEGPTHNGMGATGWGSFAAGAYNRASGAGAVAIGFHNVAGPTGSDITSIPPSTTNLGGQFAVGYGTQATGHTAFSSGFSTVASGNYSTAMGNDSDASGNFSTAFGYGTSALGTISTAMGIATTAAGYAATAMGFNSFAGGNYSTATGYITSAGGYASFSAGEFTYATGDYSTAMGYETTASGDNSTAMGYYTEASGGYGSIAMGNQTTASGDNSTVMGEGGTASGAASTAMGRGTTASDYASLVVGQYNSSGSTANSPEAFSTSNTAFVVGNGTDNSNKSDAFKVMFNGDTTVSNDLTVNGDVNISSDARLKSNIVTLGSTLSKLLLIDGKSYIMNKSGKEKIGILAQEVQKVFPELVSKDDDEMLSVNYQGLVPVLINAIKEQEDKISRLENLVEQLISEK